MNERYIRQTMIPEIGEAGQEKLKNAKVLIVGIGGFQKATYKGKFFIPRQK